MDSHSIALAEIFQYLVPEMVLGVTACVLFLGGTFRANRHLWGWVALGGLVLALVAVRLSPLPELSSVGLFAVPVRFDELVTFVRNLSILGGMLLVLFSWSELPDRQASDHHACLCIVVAGLNLTAASNDLITLFLALEMVSIPTYVMLYLPRFDDASQEASMKYFLLSVFSSSLLLFGFSYLYGLTGTTNLSGILHTLNGTAAREMPVIAQIALIMIVAGLAFRVTAAPFHFYAPDVYQGTSFVGAAFLAFVPKVAGFVALIRVLGFVLPLSPVGIDSPDGPLGIVPRNGHIGMGLSDQAPILFWFLAAVTMSLGNVFGLLQDNIKRMLAYSSVAHAGYMLVALATAPYLRGGATGPDGIEALLFYLVAYGAMTIGAFAVLAYLSTPPRPADTVDDLAGLGRSHPILALLMALFLFSLIGIPLTAGFTGKFLIFFGAMAISEDPYIFRLLAVIGMVNAAIGGWYYLRVVAVMYLRNPLRPLEGKPTPTRVATLATCALLTLGLSIPPAAGWLMKATKDAASGKAPTRPVQAAGR